MSEHDIHTKIQLLIATEHKLRAESQAGDIDPAQEKVELASIERALDQCWDLLRQRRARIDAGKSPDSAQVSSIGQVEGYLQ